MSLSIVSAASAPHMWSRGGRGHHGGRWGHVGAPTLEHGWFIVTHLGTIFYRDRILTFGLRHDMRLWLGYNWVALGAAESGPLKREVFLKKGHRRSGPALYSPVSTLPLTCLQYTKTLYIIM